MKAVSVRQNIENLQQEVDKVLNHPMCFKLREEKYHIMVLFPCEVGGLGGVRIEKTSSKAETYKRLLAKLEDAWQLDNPVLYPSKRGW